MIKMIRKKLRNIHSYILFREALREGLMNFIKRKLIQNKILKTNAIRTAEDGPIEVRVLTWRKDYINLLWALKSFYKTANVDYPLYIHDGGLKNMLIMSSIVTLIRIIFIAQKNIVIPI